jgi:hypothetical protein
MEGVIGLSPLEGFHLLVITLACNVLVSTVWLPPAGSRPCSCMCLYATDKEHEHLLDISSLDQRKSFHTPLHFDGHT